MESKTIIVARWETKGKDWLQLEKTSRPTGGFWYSYKGSGCGGTFGNNVTTDDQVIAHMERPWNSGTGPGPVTVLRADRSSLKRVK